MDERALADRKFRALLESAPDSIVIVDREGRIAIVNQQVEQMFGYGRDELIGQPVEILVPERFRAPHVADRDGYIASPRTRPMGAGLELFARRKDGSELPVEISLSPLQDPDGMLVTSIVRDVSDRKRVEGQLRDAARELQLSNAELEELQQLREEWTSVIAHDLRQPVAAISFYAQALALTAAADEALQRIQPRVESIVDATQQLDRMISDLLDVTRLGAGRLAIERVRVDLMALLERVIERFSRDGDHPIELRSLGGVSSVDADPGRLEQILENLISNALKYRELNTRVVVAARHRDNEIEVAVTNSGAGISAAELPGLFTRFYRTASANRNGAPGLGLGLYITRELVQAHGGRVWVESLPGQQTTFRFTLPVHT